MATTGRAAYVKYFNFGKEIATTLKKDSPKYGANDSKTEGSVKKGTVVTYINEGEYQSKALVREDNNLYRVKFDSLAKPGSKASSRVDLNCFKHT
jgi:hypothetical protein